VARLRHSSEQNMASVVQVVPQQYYLGQNLYHKLVQEHNNLVYLQDFYRNPGFHHQPPLPLCNPAASAGYQGLLAGGDVPPRDGLFTNNNYDNISDTASESSDMSENFVPRIIRPRRRRKKERRRGTTRGSSATTTEAEESCLGSERQWLPTGLLSEASSEEELSVSNHPGPRRRSKLTPTLSMPVYPSHTMVGQSQPGVTSPSSDYSSMASSTSETPATSSNDHLFDSDSGSTHSVSEAENGEAQPPIGSTMAAPTTANNNNVCSSKLSQKSRSAEEPRGRRNEHNDTRMYKPTPLRKTNSWAFMTSSAKSQNMLASPAQFTLFSPGNNLDLLSGIKKNLSRIDLNDDKNDDK